MDQARISGYAVFEGKRLPIGMIDGTMDGVDKTIYTGVANHSDGWLDNEDITAILPPDDPDVERITDIEKVRVGDTEVTKDGNRYEVVEVDLPSKSARDASLCVMASDRLPYWMYDVAFAYAERPKLHLPEIRDYVMGPLFFKDAEGHEVVYWKSVEDDINPYMSSNPQAEYVDIWNGHGDMPDYITLPLTPCHLEADK